MLLQHFTHQVIIPTIKLREVLPHGLSDYLSGLVIHKAMYLIGGCCSGSLKLLQQRKEQCKERIDGKVPTDGTSPKIIIHNFLDIFIRKMGSGILLKLLLIQIGQLLSNLGADRVCIVTCAFYPIDRIDECSHEFLYASPSIVN